MIEDLTTHPIPPGPILVEFDPVSQWYNACITIAAGWLKQGGRCWYHDYTQTPDSIRLKLKRLGLDVEDLEKNEKFQVWDWYTCQLGKKSKEKFAMESMKVADLSIKHSRDLMRPAPPEVLGIADNTSAVARFNDEKAWVEYVLTRVIPTTHVEGMTLIRGVMKGVHSEWAYKQLEGAHHGVIEFGVDEVAKGSKNFIAIRSMRDVGYDSRLHPLKIDENLQITLEK